MNKRTIPRHVDGRIKVGFMPIKNFFKFFIFVVIGFVFIMKNLSPFNLFATFVVLGLIGVMFSEFNQKETGFDILKDIIRYHLEGDILYERSCNNIEDTKKLIWNKIK